MYTKGITVHQSSCAVVWACLPSPFPLSSSSSKYLFQNQCFFHTLSVISSMGIPLVSGNKKMANNSMTRIHAAKKKKIPARMWQSMVRNAWAMRKVNNMLVPTAKKKPAFRTSNGKISLGINHPKGPHDHANPDTKKHIKTTTAVAYVGDIVFVVFNWVEIIPPITDYKLKTITS